MPLIWTNENDRVERTHYKPELLDESQKEGSISVDSVPTPDSEEDGTPVLYYTSESGFWYQYK
jgi:hypothetical protein